MARLSEDVFSWALALLVAMSTCAVAANGPGGADADRGCGWNGPLRPKTDRGALAGGGAAGANDPVARTGAATRPDEGGPARLAETAPDFFATDCSAGS